MKNEQNAPKIRFKGFTDAWEQRELGKIGETYTGLTGKTKEDFGHGEAKFVTYMNVFSNPVAEISMTEPIEIDKKQNEVKFGDVFFTTSSETPEEVGMSSVWLENCDNMYLNSFCFGYRPSEKINPYYMAYMLRSENVRKKITFLAQGISRYNISKNKMMEISIPLPSFEEQRQIGAYFRNLDHLITLHQRKCETLKKLKKSMLQKMFPKNGSHFPEIRFAGFTDAWELRKLGEVCQINGRIGFRGYTEKDIISKEKGGVLAFTPTNIVNNHLVLNVRNTYITRIKYDESPEIMVENGNILFVKTGSTLGKSALITGLNEDSTVNPQVVVIKTDIPNQKILSTILTTDKVQSQIASVKIGGAVPTMTETELKNIELAIPINEDEKKQIGAYFRTLDHLITLHQRKLETLKKLKKAMLQKMFI